MKRLSEFKSDDDEYRLSDIQRFQDQFTWETKMSWSEFQALIQDLIKSNQLLLDYAEKMERGGYGD